MDHPKPTTGSGAVFPGHLEALHDLGRREEFDALLPAFLAIHEAECPLLVAQLHAWLDDKDEAFRWQALLEQYGMTDEKLASLDLDIRLPPGVEL